MNGRERRTLVRITIAVGLLLLAGTFGFARFNHIGYGDALYSTVIILIAHYDHNGYTELSSRLLVIFLDIASLVVVAYLLKWFAEYMIGIGDNVKRRRMKAKVDQLKNHYIVCGLGRVGAQVAKELHNEGIAFVGLDREPERVEEALAQGYLAMPGDSTLEETLTQAGIEHATGLIASLGEDSLNLFVVLAARSMNPKLYIVARANRPENQVKLKRAGADRVAMPYQIGGYHMANMALRPNVVDYMDIVSKGGTSELAVEEMVVGEHSKLTGHRLGQSLADASMKGATVIAINGADGTSKVQPTGKEVIYAGDRLILLGARADLTQASALIR
jgi:voltage-gated potassium channel